MKSEYDFSNGVVGKFYFPDIPKSVPVYFDSELIQRLEIRADQLGLDFDLMVEQILRRELEQPLTKS